MFTTTNCCFIEEYSDYQVPDDSQQPNNLPDFGRNHNWLGHEFHQFIVSIGNRKHSYGDDQSSSWRNNIAIPIGFGVLGLFGIIVLFAIVIFYSQRRNRRQLPRNGRRRTVNSGPANNPTAMEPPSYDDIFKTSSSNMPPTYDDVLKVSTTN